MIRSTFSSYTSLPISTRKRRDETSPRERIRSKAISTNFTPERELDTQGNTKVQICELKHRYCVKYNIDEEVVVKNPAFPAGPEYISKRASSKGERFISRDALVDGKQLVACANALGVEVCLLMEKHEKHFDVHMEISGVDVGRPLLAIPFEDVPYVDG